MRTATAITEVWPIEGSFTISRGSKTAAHVIVCTIGDDNGNSGRGESVPYARYGESVDTVLEAIAAVPGEALGSREALNNALPAGAARNALDCALWDLELKSGVIERTAISRLPVNGNLQTAYTLSLDTPDKMERKAREYGWRGLLKMKAGTAEDEARIAAVRRGAPNARLIVDANEGWTTENVEEMLGFCARMLVDLVEQPLPAGSDDILSGIERPVPVCADESAHTAADLDKLTGKYDCINIKLDKTGGLTEALIMRQRARDLGFSIMIGCMVGTSLAMAPAVLLAEGADYVDLDGPLLLARDRVDALIYEGDTVSPPSPALWG